MTIFIIYVLVNLILSIICFHYACIGVSIKQIFLFCLSIMFMQPVIEFGIGILKAFFE